MVCLRWSRAEVVLVGAEIESVGVEVVLVGAENESVGVEVVGVVFCGFVVCMAVAGEGQGTVEM